MTETPQVPLVLATVKAAATALACSEDQVRIFLADGTLPCVPLGKSGVRTTWEAIYAFAQRRREAEQEAVA